MIIISKSETAQYITKLHYKLTKRRPEEVWAKTLKLKSSKISLFFKEINKSTYKMNSKVTLAACFYNPTIPVVH